MFVMANTRGFCNQKVIPICGLQLISLKESSGEACPVLPIQVNISTLLNIYWLSWLKNLPKALSVSLLD